MPTMTYFSPHGASLCPLETQPSFAVVVLMLDMSHAIFIASAQSLELYPSSMVSNIATDVSFRRLRALSVTPLY